MSVLSNISIKIQTVSSTTVKTHFITYANLNNTQATYTSFGSVFDNAGVTHLGQLARQIVFVILQK